MLSDKNSYHSRFKRNELAFELRHEDAAMGHYNPHNKSYSHDFVSVHINGKFWKKMSRRQAQQAANTLKSKGKKVEFF